MPTISNNKNKTTSGDLLWSQSIFGDDGDSKKIAAELRVYADADATSGAVAGRFEVWTANSSGTLVRAFKADSSQILTPGVGGIAPLSAPSGFSNFNPASTTTGTDTAFANNSLFVSSLYVPNNFTATGVQFLVGASTNGADRAIAALWDSTGAVLANSTTASAGTVVAVGASSSVVSLAFTSSYVMKGPATFFVGIGVNANTTSFRAIPPGANSGLWCGSVSWTHGTVASITPPSTFTANKGPMLFVY